jgi:formylglycine-generating enzyme required for sulfatase activity
MGPRTPSTRTVVLAAVTGFAVLAVAVPGRHIAAQTIRPTPSTGGFWAVVIGIDAYQHAAPLQYAVNSARAIERALPGLGVRADHLVVVIDRQATRATIEKILAEDLRRKVARDDRLLVFFAGHGLTEQVRPGQDEGYLLPVDGDPTRLSSTGISMMRIRQISERLAARHILYIMDASFSGYPVFNRSISDQLLDDYLRKRAIQIVTAGRQHEVPQARGGIGLFTDILVHGLQSDAYAGKNWLALEELGAWVRRRVVAESNQKQTPGYGTLVGEGQFIFQKPTVALLSPPPSAPVSASPPRGSLRVATKVPGVEIWLGDRQIGEAGPERPLIAPDLAVGTYRVRARKGGHQDWERDVQVKANAATDVPIDIEPLRPPSVTTPDDLGEMVLVAAGEFWMGTSAEESARLIETCRRAGRDERECRDRYAAESPRHRVHLDAFYIDRYEITNAQYQRFVDATTRRKPVVPDPAFAGPTQPVGGVTWNDADAYCKWAGKRLPTEAEWEKAARGPEGRRYPWGDEWDERRANGNRRLTRTAPVGSYPDGASPYGIHDMAGNVWEWVADWYGSDAYGRFGRTQNPTGPRTGDRKVLRGGSAFDGPDALRSASRLAYLPTDQDGNVGFRCAKSSR